MEQISPERQTELTALETRLGAAFLNKLILNQALTHSSFGHENNIADNERLEFLGDAVLKLVISEYIYNIYPDKNEGDLTKIRATVISDESLAKIGARLDLGSFLLMSDNEKKTGGIRRKSNLANTLEAIIGAIYLDQGLGKARDFIVGFLNESIERVSKAGYISDFKSALQEIAQKKKWELPRYRVVKETGLKHRRVFWMEVKLKGKVLGVGRGRNKKEAEQRAAMQALRHVKREDKEVKPTRGLRTFISNVRKKIKI
jgi:ribonuclease-3